MKRPSAILCESLRYACFTLAVAFGFVTIIGTGGGGSGSTTQPASQNLITTFTAPRIASSIGNMTTGIEGALFAITLDVGSGAYSPKTLFQHVDDFVQDKGAPLTGSSLPVRLLGSISDTEDCYNGGSVTTTISWDGSLVPTDCSDVIDPALDFLFEDCQEDSETMNGAVGISFEGTLCQKTPPEFSMYFTDFSYQNQNDDSDFVMDLSMDFKDVQYDDSDYMLGMYLAMDGRIYGTIEGDSVDLIYDDWAMDFDEIGYDVSNEITGLYLSLDGSFSGSIKGSSFDEAYQNIVITFQNTTIDSVPGISFTVDGSYNGGCLDGWINIETVDPIFIPHSGDSPTSGQLRISGSGEATILFKSNGSMTISVDGEELSYSNYDDLPSCI
ncbi:MAG: hypothetical protein JW896_05675 [Deltaproteobacteria bacterium]|nr:hypothetical protein [Deltaproteobacteria bacterium]